ncbi:MAG TPA: peptide chain release factor N(5)-glutamine methyltransferase [Cyclobacteriaceae bacterium]|nr:peptide chain release factor N(5)-glutamine methyltransferase [Cyclobacteriaceae bacterium]
MANSKDVFKAFVQSIRLNEDPEEIKCIAHLVFEKYLGCSKTDIAANNKIDKYEVKYKDLKKIAERINAHEPIQYILQEADFYGRSFFVNKDVLIPRPETEELVQHVIDCCKKARKKKVSVLDIGTGSGCIPITIKLALPDAQLSATDVSEAALMVAAENSLRHSVQINWQHHNILKQSLPGDEFDVIVSNPPYITEAEKTDIKLNVLYYEPSLALFVPTKQALMFYEAIGKKALKALKPGGKLFLEINEKLGAETQSLLKDFGYRTELIKDLQGKDRIIIASKRKSS